MTNTNNITGDKLISKVPTQEYLDNYDRIFGKKKEDKIFVRRCPGKSRVFSEWQDILRQSEEDND